jgi:lantibiotic modifying enzyme
LAGVARLGNLNHGASGICHALLQLYRKTGDADLLASAREGLAYESRLFDPNQGGWRDLRFPSQDYFGLSWCSGSPGMAVARLAAHDLLGDPGIQEEAEIAVTALCQTALLETDHLCCGNCGVVEALLSAAMIQENEALAAEASKRILVMIDRSKVHGTFAFRRASSPSTFDPSFFTGAAGLGYTFLRLIVPSSLPSVLLLQPVP